MLQVVKAVVNKGSCILEHRRVVFLLHASAEVLLMLDVHDPHDLLRLAIQEASMHEVLAERSKLLSLCIIEIDSNFEGALSLNASEYESVVNPDWESVQAKQNFTLWRAIPSNGLLAMEENQRLVPEED